MNQVLITGIAAAVGCLMSVGVAVDARAASSLQTAFQIGDLIGSEAGCGLAFDQGAIQRFIESKVSDADMDFTGSMNSHANAVAYRLQSFSASQKTAHCTQVKRVAKKYGFLK